MTSEHLRVLNLILGVPALALLCWRTPPMVAKLASKRLYAALALFPVLVVFGTVNAVATSRPPSPLTICFTAAFGFLDMVLIWLPRGLR